MGNKIKFTVKLRNNNKQTIHVRRRCSHRLHSTEIEQPPRFIATSFFSVAVLCCAGWLTWRYVVASCSIASSPVSLQYRKNESRFNAYNNFNVKTLSTRHVSYIFRQLYVFCFRRLQRFTKQMFGLFGLVFCRIGQVVKVICSHAIHIFLEMETTLVIVFLFRQFRIWSYYIWLSEHWFWLFWHHKSVEITRHECRYRFSLCVRCWYSVTPLDVWLWHHDFDL